VEEEPVTMPEDLISAEQIAAIFAEAEAEDARALALCDTLLTGSSTAWWDRFQETPDTRTPGVVRQLLARIPALFERRPVDALEASSIAMAIAETLDPQKFWMDYVLMVRGQALRDHAFILALLGGHAEALAFVERAERTFAQVDAVSLDLAQLALVKAVVLAALDRSGEVPEPLRAAKEIYLAIEDQWRHEEICLAEAALMAEAMDAGALREAAVRLLGWRAGGDSGGCGRPPSIGQASPFDRAGQSLRWGSKILLVARGSDPFFS